MKCAFCKNEAEDYTALPLAEGKCCESCYKRVIEPVNRLSEKGKDIKLRFKGNLGNEKVGTLVNIENNGYLYVITDFQTMDGVIMSPTKYFEVVED